MLHIALTAICLLVLGGAAVLLGPVLRRMRMIEEFYTVNRLPWLEFQMDGRDARQLDSIRNAADLAIERVNETILAGMPQIPTLGSSTFYTCLGRRMTEINVHHIPPDPRGGAEFLRRAVEVETLRINLGADDTGSGACFDISFIPPYQIDRHENPRSAVMLTVLEAAPHMPRLRELRLDGQGNHPSQEGWARIVARCQGVERLTVGSHGPPAEALELLAGMPSLREIRLPYNAPVAAGTLRHMREINPALRIVFLPMYATETPMGPGTLGDAVVWLEMGDTPKEWRARPQ